MRSWCAFMVRLRGIVLIGLLHEMECARMTIHHLIDKLETLELENETDIHFNSSEASAPFALEGQPLATQMEHMSSVVREVRIAIADSISIAKQAQWSKEVSPNTSAMSPPNHSVHVAAELAPERFSEQAGGLLQTTWFTPEKLISIPMSQTGLGIVASISFLIGFCCVFAVCGIPHKAHKAKKVKGFDPADRLRKIFGGGRKKAQEGADITRAPSLPFGNDFFATGRRPSQL